MDEVQLKLTEKLKEILEVAKKKKNVLEYTEVNEYFREIELSPEQMEHILEYLEENGVDVTWVSVPGYTHEWRFWNLAVEEFLKWIPRTDGYAVGGKRQI